MQPSSSDSTIDSESTYHDDELAGSAVSMLAVVGLVLALVSVTAIIHPVMWCLPILALITNILALRRIDYYWPELVGRPIAWTGLAMTIVIGVAAPSLFAARKPLAELEGRRFASIFFEKLREDLPEQAYQLTLEAEVRQPVDDQLWAKYRASGERMQAFKEFVANPAVRALLELGDRATVRYYETEQYERRAAQLALFNIYSVSYLDDAGQKQSFFVRALLVRKQDYQGEYGWYVRLNGPIRPADWPETLAP